MEHQKIIRILLGCISITVVCMTGTTSGQADEDEDFINILAVISEAINGDPSTPGACSDISTFTSQITPANPGSEFLRVNGQQLVIGAEATPVLIRGTNVTAHQMHTPDQSAVVTEGFTGTPYPLTDDYQPSSFGFDPYTNSHFETLAELGFNSIRLTISYRVLEDNGSPCEYKQQGWDFIDKYIGFAGNNNMFLIIAIAVPQGGFQPTAGGGSQLWDNTENQVRLVNMWRAIASRYADDPIVSGYDLVNEPNPTPGCEQEEYFTPACLFPYGAEKWQELAQTITNAIRSVDRNHLILHQTVNAIYDSDGFSPLAELTPETIDAFQFTINDNNVLYDFHFYEPATYTLAYDGCESVEACPERTPSPGLYPSEDTVASIASGNIPFDREFLESQLMSFREFGTINNVPMHVGEWGGPILGNVDGWETYTSDMLCLMDELDLHWSHFYLNFFYTDGSLQTIVPDRSAPFSEYLSEGCN